MSLGRSSISHSSSPEKITYQFNIDDALVRYIGAEIRKLQTINPKTLLNINRVFAQGPRPYLKVAGHQPLRTGVEDSCIEDRKKSLFSLYAYKRRPFSTTAILLTQITAL